MLVSAAFVLGVCVHVWVLQHFPNSADEYAYLWQAEALAGGHLTARTPEPRDAFAFFHLGDRDGVRYSRFPPGFPLLLVPGVLLGVPGLINPLLAALGLGVTYLLGVRWVGPRAALVGVLLVLLSPFYLLNAGSFHSHPSAMFAIVCAVYAADRAKRHHRAGRWLVACGAGLGTAFLVRPYTAVLIGVPLALWASRVEGEDEGRRFGTWVRRLAWVAAGGMPFLAVYLGVNHAISGSVWVPATRYLDPEEGVGFGVHGHTLHQGLKNTFFWFLEGFGYTFFMTPLLLLLARGRAGRREKLLWAWMGVLVVGYLFYWNPGGNRYGPRFYFEALPAFALLTGVGAVEAFSRRPLRPILALFAIIGLAATARTLAVHHHQVAARRDVYRQVAALGLDHAVVILLSGAGDMPVYDLTRNPPEFASAPVLYARGLGPADKALLDRFPDRDFYYYRQRNGTGRLWRTDLAQPEEPDPLPDH